LNATQFNSFKEFYPYYLSEHSKAGTKLLHFVGTLCVIIFMILYFIYKDYIYLLFMPIFGYGFAWISHFFIERNKPATFKYPLYSLQGDFLMFWHILIRKIKFNVGD